MYPAAVSHSAEVAVLGIVVDPTTEGLSDSKIIRREIQSVCSPSPGFAVHPEMIAVIRL